MALLDFIKNRDGQRPAGEQQSQQQQSSETYKQQKTREAVEEKANRIAPTPDQEQRAQKIGDEFRKATEQKQETPAAVQAAPEDQGGNSAHIQKSANQNREQAALSPTDDASGKTATQEKSASQEKGPERSQQTVARRPPSWER